MIKQKFALVPDHFTPNKDIKSAQQALKVRTFAKEQDIVNYFEVGEVGIEHALLPEKGLGISELHDDKTAIAKARLKTRFSHN